MHNSELARPLRRFLPQLFGHLRPGKRGKEMAKIVSISEATVKTRMFYARRKLAELVEMT